MAKKKGGKLNAAPPFRTGSSSGGSTGMPGTSNVMGGGKGKSKRGKLNAAKPLRHGK